MYCTKCGQEIDDEAVVCPKCGVQTANMKAQQQPQIVINNANTNVNAALVSPKSKMVALLLAIFLDSVYTRYVVK